MSSQTTTTTTLFKDNNNKMESLKSFRQFEYCPLCKLSHKKRKKHVYSKRHQSIIKNILQKFAIKINKMKQNLFSPEVMSANVEKEAKFWCYFCAAEYVKHTMVEDCLISGSGILHHIASEEHKLGMEKFFWDNFLPKELKPKYVLSKEDLHIFQRASLLAVKKCQREKTLERRKITESIRQMEAKRSESMMTELWQSEIVASSSSMSDLPGNRAREVPQIDSDKLEQGYSSLGLTRIKRTTDDSEGNVHTGAVPPWLQKDDKVENSSREIGPTLKDFQKHLEREKKAKLPSCRVGAKFDHNSATSADWLPSFGRVWSKGRRLQSKLHFEKHLKGKTPLNPSKGKGPKKSSSSQSSDNIATEHYSSCNGKTQFTNKQTEGVYTNQVQHTVQYKHNQNVAKSCDSFNQWIQKPYQTKQQKPYQTKQASSYSSGEYSNSEQNSAKNITIVPYKRRKIDANENGRDIQLLHTPVLSKQM